MAAIPPSGRTKVITEIANDVTILKKEVVEQNTKIEHIASWIKDNFKPVIEDIKDKFGTEVELLKQGIDGNAKFGKNLANWIKDNLGTKMEKLNELITTEVIKTSYTKGKTNA